MTERERLRELLLKCDPIKERDLDDDWGDGELDDIVDHLLANGVIVPPCKVGDTVYLLDDIVWAHECGECPYFIEGWYDYPHECGKTKDGRKHHDCIELIEHVVTQNDVYSYLRFSLFGKTVFLTREEAEKVITDKTKNITDK